MKLRNILLVEDNPGDVELTREGLKGAGVECEISVVRDGEAAIAWLNHRPPYADAQRPDVVLLDLNLPRASGFEVLADIKQSAELRRIPVLILSSSRAEEDISAAYDQYANAYVAKPMGLDGFEEVAKAIRGFWLDLAELPPAT